MGIYGALATAVTGLRAQATALANISGNIANSQTTGYKRMETSFVDLIPDAAVGRQIPGAVLANSRSTKNVRGDIITSPTSTHVALNGSGFFVVAEKTGVSDGQSVFGDASFYTRRGDFEMDREGYLVNGAGYYLKGVPVDRSTGNVSGSVPEMIKIDNGLLPAMATRRIDYQLNLPAVPAVGMLGSTAQTVSNAGGYDDNTALLVGDLGYGEGDISLTINGTTNNFTVDSTTTVGNFRAWLDSLAGINTALEGTDNRLVIAADDPEVDFTITDADDILPAGIESAVAPKFVDQTVEGGAITVYAPNGASANVQLRWGKVSDAPDSWELYYMSERDPQQWDMVPGGTFTFNNDGTLATRNGATVQPGDRVSIAISDLTVNGVEVNDQVELNFGTGGLTQFDNANGRASITQLYQNGYPAGTFMSVAVNDSGRVVATYSNGQQIDIFQLVTANFNAENMLKRMDGGIYAATAQSGEAILALDGGITGGALETSNTDISEEFTKLITTQQAYAAGTRIVSTSDEMLREALNMVR
jgi:flagellar hook protein FlgE